MTAPAGGNFLAAEEIGQEWDKGGVKIEHCCVVTYNGVEPFSRVPKDDLIFCGLPVKY